MVFRKLNSSAAVIEEMTGVRIVRVVMKLCAGVDCPLHFCDEVVSLDKASMSTYSTARLSFVTPRHQRTATCQCEGRTPPRGRPGSVAHRHTPPEQTLPPLGLTRAPTTSLSFLKPGL